MKPYSGFLAVLEYGYANIEQWQTAHGNWSRSEAKTQLTSRLEALLSDFVYLAPETIAKRGD
jgi:hypothetical protein